MKLFELFDKVANYKQLSSNRYQFTIDDLAYEAKFMNQELDKFIQTYMDKEETLYGYEVDFKLLGTKNEFGITNTGNEIIVFSTILQIMKEFIDTNKPDYFYFSAEEKSRQKMYDRLSKRIAKITGYTFITTNIDSYGKHYYFKK